MLGRSGNGARGGMVGKNGAGAAGQRVKYCAKRAVFSASAASILPDAVEITHPEGGLFLWLTLPEGVNARELLEKSLEQHVAFVPGGAFFPNGGHENTARINFSCMPPEKIEEGSRRLCRVVREYLG